MNTIKTGRDFTGYLMFHSRRTGATVRLFVGRYWFNGYEADGTTPLSRDAHARRVISPMGGSWSIDAGRPVYGRYVSEVVCGARCMSAIGENCDCSCGGLNHGAGHGIVKGAAR